MFDRFTKAVKDEAADPEARAAAKQAAGTAMIADGLVGLENPFDDKKSRVGIFGALVMVAFGLVFVVAGLWIRSSTTAADGDIIVEGLVTDTTRSSTSDGDTTYAPVVEYVDPASGETYVATGSISSSKRPTIGDTREVAYPPGSPGSAKVLGDEWFGWIFVGVGGLVMAIALGTFLIRLGTLAFGAKLLLDGRRERKAMGSEAGVIETLADSATDVFNATRAEPNESAVPTSPPVTPKMPPAGWYPDPDDGSGHRWFDGTAWTEHRQNAA